MQKVTVCETHQHLHFGAPCCNRDLVLRLVLHDTSTLKPLHPETKVQRAFFSDSENEMLSCQPSGIVMDTLCYPKVSIGLCGMDLSFDISEHRKFMEIPFWDVTVQK